MSLHVRSLLALVAPTGVAALLLGGLVGCTAPDRVVLLYPDRGDAARKVVDLGYTQRVTLPDVFVYRPDEFGSVVVDHDRGLVYGGGREGTLLALDERDGSIVWEAPLGGALSGRPILVEEDGHDLMLVGTDDGIFYAWDLDTREPLWTYETSGTIRNAPVVGEDVVYFTNSREQVFALDLRDGTWRWQYEQELPKDFTIHGRAGLTLVQRGDAVSGEMGVIYTGFDDGRVVAIGATSGEALWVTNLASEQADQFSDVDSTPLVLEEEEQLVVACQGTGVFGLSLADGSVRWNKPVVGAGTVVRGPGGVLIFASSLEGIYAIEPGGRERWHQQVDPGVLSDPVVVGHTVFFTHSESGLLAFDTRSGEFLARLDVGSGMSSKPLYDETSGRFYVTSNRGMLFAFQVGEDVTGP